MMLLLSIVPFITLFFIMVVLKRPAIVAAPLTLIITLLISLYWGHSAILESFGRASLTTLEIMFIIFGAVFLLNILQSTNTFEVIKKSLNTISSDIRIQVILISWFFVSFSGYLSALPYLFSRNPVPSLFSLYIPKIWTLSIRSPLLWTSTNDSILPVALPLSLSFP